MKPLPEPRLLLIPAPPDVLGDPQWFFLSYDYDDPDFRAFNRRWLITCRQRHEDFILVCGFPFTAERALDLIPKELALAREAIAQLRGQAFAPPPAASPRP